jgi:hypothetical protein
LLRAQEYAYYTGFSTMNARLCCTYIRMALTMLKGEAVFHQFIEDNMFPVLREMIGDSVPKEIVPDASFYERIGCSLD